jgi:hypothetical protein
MIRWIEHVANLGKVRNICKRLVKKYEGKRILENIGVDGRIILKLSLRKWDWGGGFYIYLIQDMY